MEKHDIKRVFETAILAGKIMLENGAETYRVEDTINRMCHAYGLQDMQNFTVPTGIFLSAEVDEEFYSYVVRIKPSSIDLEIISRVNDFSRKFVSREIPLVKSQEILKEIRRAPRFSTLVHGFFGGVAGGFFTMTFGGRISEGIASFIISVALVILVRKIGDATSSFFLKHLVGGMISTLFALLLVGGADLFSLVLQRDMIIIGPLMTLVPGVAFTNALRDTISGDFVSGVSKLAEAIMIAVAIAFGVGSVLQVELLIGGVL